MKWKKIKKINKFPINRSFILYDKKAESGLHIYEAMLFDDGSIGCPATFEIYDLNDFSHWREMIKLPINGE